MENTKRKPGDLILHQPREVQEKISSSKSKKTKSRSVDFANARVRGIMIFSCGINRNKVYHFFYCCAIFFTKGISRLFGRADPVPGGVIAKSGRTFLPIQLGEIIMNGE